MPGGQGGAHQAVAGVAHQRRARIRHQGDAGAARQAGQQAVHPCRLVMLVQWLGARGDAVMGEQAGGQARILAQDQVSAAQRLDAAHRHVAEVADGGGNQHKTGCIGLVLF
jgi:hypothetical protein